MFGSKILDVALGLIFVYILVSILCSTIREGIEAFLKTRAAYLERGIRELLRDRGGSGLAKDFFSHPLIAGLYTATEYKRPRWRHLGIGLPSYIPSQSFATALLDLAARGKGGAMQPITLDNLRATVAQLGNPEVQRVLLTALDAAGNDLDKARKELEAWYDSAMDRVAGWYRRTTQWILLVIAIAIAVGLNVDTLAVVQGLYRDDSAREAAVAAAERAQDSMTFDEAKRQLADLRLPGAWPLSPEQRRQPAQVVLGWLLTALAATLGAPFWFDVLNKIMVVRSTVKPREKSPEEKKKDS